MFNYKKKMFNENEFFFFLCQKKTKYFVFLSLNAQIPKASEKKKLSAVSPKLT
jgi:hypothetical protein